MGDKGGRSSQPALPGSIVCFGAKGIYRLNLENGSCQKVFSGAWGGIRSAVRDPQQDGIFAFGVAGIYHVAKDGTHKKYLSGRWAVFDDKSDRGQTACYIGEGKALYIGAKRIYSVNLRDGTYEKLASRGFWRMCKSAVYNEHDGFVYIFGLRGVYKVNPDNGEHERIASGNWFMVEASLCLNKDSLMCFGGTGIWRLNLKDGTDTKLVGGAWGGSHVAVHDPVKGAIVFCNSGVYRVHTQDGTPSFSWHEKLIGGNWFGVHGGVHDPTPAELTNVDA